MTKQTASSSRLFAPLYAGALYFGIVFVIAFVLGAIRHAFVVPKLGELAGVLIELPIILTLAWFASGYVIGLTRVPAELPTRLAMSVVAFLLLMLAELALSVWLFGNSPSAFLASSRTPHGALGLAGQLLFGLFPLIRLGKQPPC